MYRYKKLHNASYTLWKIDITAIILLLKKIGLVATPMDIFRVIRKLMLKFPAIVKLILVLKHMKNWDRVLWHRNRNIKWSVYCQYGFYPYWQYTTILYLYFYLYSAYAAHYALWHSYMDILYLQINYNFIYLFAKIQLKPL